MGERRQSKSEFPKLSTEIFIDRTHLRQQNISVSSILLNKWLISCDLSPILFAFPHFAIIAELLTEPSLAKLAHILGQAAFMLSKNDSNFSEYYPITNVQRFFLQKAIQLKPELIDDLLTFAGHTYSAFSLSLQLSQMTSTKGFIQMPVVTTLKWTELANKLDAMNLRRALLVWADRWNINAEWCLDYGLRFLDKDYRSQIGRNIFGEQEHNPAHRKLVNERIHFNKIIGNMMLETLLNKHGDLPSPPQGWPVWNPIRENHQDYIKCVTYEALKTIEGNALMCSHRETSGTKKMPG